MGAPALLLSKLPKAAKKENDEVYAIVKAVIRQFRDSCTKVVYPADTTAALNTFKDIAIQVQDADSVRQLFGDNKIGRIRVTVKAGSTATGIVLQNDEGKASAAGGVGTTLDVNFTEGQSILKVKASGAGTVILTLTDLDATGLTVTDECTITVS